MEGAVDAPRAWRGIRAAPGDAVAAASGALLPFSFAPFGLFYLAPLALAGFFLALEGQSPRRAAWRGFLFGLAVFLLGIYWVHISIHVFGGAPLSLSLLLMFALVLYMAAYPAFFGYAVNRWFAQGGALRALLVLPAAWVLMEWTRGWLFSGFPWLTVGYSQSDSPLLGFAAVSGVFGLSAAVALTAGLLPAWVAQRRARPWLLVPVVAVWLVAAVLGRVEWTRTAGEPVTVSLVQGSVPQELKWLPEQLQPTVDLYLGLTDQHLGSDLIVWPEAAIPTARHNLDPLFDVLLDRGRRTATDFLIGAVEIERSSGRRLNTVVALNRDQVGSPPAYVKRHLVPYGEYFPVPGFVREWIRWMDLPYQDFSPGDDNQPPLEVAGLAAGISICYEDVFGEELVDVLPAADILINVSNDAWFGGSVAPHQHLQIARLRAAEAGRTMLRATNNGISAAIGARGEVLAVSPQFVPFVLTHAAQPRSGSTPYSRYANWPIVTLALVALAVARWRRRA